MKIKLITGEFKGRTVAARRVKVLGLPCFEFTLPKWIKGESGRWRGQTFVVPESWARVVES